MCIIICPIPLDPEKIVQNSKDGQWPSVSRDMCQRPVGQTAWQHWPAKNPQKRRFLTIFTTFDSGCRTNGRADCLQLHTCLTALGWPTKRCYSSGCATNTCRAKLCRQLRAGRQPAIVSDHFRQ